jgi:hypothetical protein
MPAITIFDFRSLMIARHGGASVTHYPDRGASTVSLWSCITSQRTLRRGRKSAENHGTPGVAARSSWAVRDDRADHAACGAQPSQSYCSGNYRSSDLLSSSSNPTALVELAHCTSNPKPALGRAVKPSVRKGHFWRRMLEPISKSPEEDNKAGELDESEEVLGVILPADEDAAVPLNPAPAGRDHVQ